VTSQGNNALIASAAGTRIALFFSGRKHAGENLKDVLVRRKETLDSPIQMCDALSRNLPGELQTILSHCLAHGRRRFVEVADRFPEECRHVLESLAVVYRNDAVARPVNHGHAGLIHHHPVGTEEIAGAVGEFLLVQNPASRSRTKMLENAAVAEKFLKHQLCLFPVRFWKASLKQSGVQITFQVTFHILQLRQDVVQGITAPRLLESEFFLPNRTDMPSPGVR